MHYLCVLSQKVLFSKAYMLKLCVFQIILEFYELNAQVTCESAIYKNYPQEMYVNESLQIDIDEVKRMRKKLEAKDDKLSSKSIYFHQFSK